MPNTIQAAAEGMPADTQPMPASVKPMTATAALSELEVVICDAVDASRLLAFVVESIFSNSEPDSQNGLFYLGRCEADVLSFAQRVVSNHAIDVKRQWKELRERCRAGKAVRS
jgi:hypothetical protein